MDQLTHLLGAVMFVGSATAGIVLAVHGINDALDRLATRRAIRRRLQAFPR